MGKFVSPKVFMVGYTGVDFDGLRDYLCYTGQEDFLDTFNAARRSGVSEGEVLCSFMAKLCYKSLVLGKNANISRVRDVRDNLKSVFDTGHLSVMEHLALNFVITDCSRVFSHELVRHRSGTAFSQTSGRYCRLDSIDLVWDPVLDGCGDIVREHLVATEQAVYLMECKLGLRKPPDGCPDKVKHMPEFWECAPEGEREQYKWVPDNSFDFEKRKRITSAIRRIAPNGQSNEIGLTVNVRALRHMVQLRTSRHAEWEIRVVFNKVYDLVTDKFPVIFQGARTREFNGLREVYGMRAQPYDLLPDDPKALSFWETPLLEAELVRRQQAQGTISS